MGKLILLFSFLAIAAIPVGASAYDPDGFHRCMLENMREGMGNAAVLAMRQSCGHLNETTSSADRLPPSIAEDSHINAFKREHGSELRADPTCRYPLTIDACIVSAFRDAWYPSRSLEEVRIWLYRSQEEYGPIPPREN